MWQMQRPFKNECMCIYTDMTTQEQHLTTLLLYSLKTTHSPIAMPKAKLNELI